MTAVRIATPETTARRDGAPAGRSHRRIIGYWLLTMALMVFAMVVLGGLTRLTQSGLSMVEWRPVTGWLPPLSHDAWEQAFRAYQAYPEYQKVNAGMTLDDFRGIFWLEYVHRLWGRLIGVAFALPFLVFLVRGWIDRGLGLRLAGLFLVGTLQGLVGWLMVKSGMVDRPDVSQYRLVAHLGLALVIYGAILWTALHLLAPRPARAPRGAQLGAAAVAGLVFVTILSGGFVAGLDAGYIYNTFPLMDGALVPSGLFASDPPWRAAFEDILTVQFLHRVLALTTVLAVLAFRLSLRGADPAPQARRAANVLTVWVFVQASLGVATLLTVVAIPLAALHQADAVVLWSLAVWTVYATSARRVAERAGGPAAQSCASAPGRGPTRTLGAVRSPDGGGEMARAEYLPDCLARRTDHIQG